MSFFDPQNPGIGGLDELTNAEEIFLTALAGLPFSEGEVLTIVSGAPSWEPASGGGVWGSITGTLSDQTDLQSALDLKANTSDIAELAQDAVGNAVGTGLDYDDTTGAISVDETELAVPAANVIMPTDSGSPTLNTLAEEFTTRGSSGVADGTITYVTVGTSANKISVASGEGYIRTTNDQQGELKFCKWAASPDLYTFSAPAAGFENVIFIGIEYSGGTTTAVAKTAFTDWNWYTNFPLARCSYDGTTMRILNAYAHSEDTANLTRKYLRLTMPFTREEAPEGSGGLELSVALRALAMTAGKVWHGFNNYSLGAVASGSAFDTHYKKAGGGFNTTTGVTAYPNTQYDNGSGTLQNLTASKYGTLWVYLDIADGSLDVVYGAVNATSVANAQLDTIPTTPEHLRYHGRLIGRIIFKKGDPSPALVESAWTSVFSASAVGDHALLTNLQGGTTNEYYHLTAAEHTIATQAATSLVSGYLSSTDWSTFNGKQPQLNGTGFVKASGTTITYDNSTYLTSVTAHNLLSSTHGDTTAGTVARGDLVTGQGVSPKWTRLALGTSGKVLQSDGTDVVWSTNALTIGASASVSGSNTGDQTSISGISGTMAQFDTACSDGNFVYNGQALGTPSSGTLTNCAGLPVSGITASTVTALGVGSIELGHASDTTIARSGAGDISVEGNVLYRAGGTDVPVTDGGTGRSTSTTAYGLIAAGTTATGALQTLPTGGTTEVLFGGGASALPTWKSTTGTGNVALADSPIFTTQIITPIVYGSDQTGSNLTLGSTSHATKGKIILGSASAYDEANDRIGIGTTAPAVLHHIKYSSSGTNDGIEMERVERVSTGTVATNFALYKSWYMENPAGTNTEALRHVVYYAGTSDGTDAYTTYWAQTSLGGLKTILSFGAQGQPTFYRYVPTGGYSSLQSAGSYHLKKGNGTLSDGIGPRVLFQCDDNGGTGYIIGGFGSSFDITNTRANIKFTVRASAADTTASTTGFQSTWAQNILVGNATEPTSLAAGIALVNGTAAASSPTDQVSLWSADAAAGKAWLWMRPEDGTNRVVVGVSGTSGVSTGTGTVKMNGATSRNSVGWLTLHDHQGTTVYVPYWTTITG